MNVRDDNKGLFLKDTQFDVNSETIEINKWTL